MAFSSKICLRSKLVNDSVLMTTQISLWLLRRILQLLFDFSGFPFYLNDESIIIESSSLLLHAMKFSYIHEQCKSNFISVPVKIDQVNDLFYWIIQSFRNSLRLMLDMNGEF